MAANDISESYKVELEIDYLEKLAKVSPIRGLEELIWNSLDADAKNIYIKYTENQLKGIDYIEVSDDGHGISFDTAKKEFSGLGGSHKRSKKRSPGNRKYHGSEGQGRFKAFSLGKYISIESIYLDNADNIIKKINASLDISNLKKFNITHPTFLSDKAQLGSRFRISGSELYPSAIFTKEICRQLEEKYTVYYLSCPDFSITMDGNKLDFDKNIKDKLEDKFEIEINGKKEEFRIKVVEWQKSNTEKKLYYCSSSGIAYEEKFHKMRVNSPISIYILSNYFETLNQDGLLLMDIDTNKEVYQITAKAKDIAREYALNRLHLQSKEYIEDLKKDGIYPYKASAKNPLEEAQRKVFDITALQIKEFLPSKSTGKEKINKELTLTLIKIALESNSSYLPTLLNEVIKLPKDKQFDLYGLLNETSFSNIIDTSKQITDRLKVIDGLRDIIIGDYKKKVLERQHLQKLIVKESWIFGDNYTLGADDTTLRKVLKKYLKHLGRDDFEERVSDKKTGLNKIPDICLWKLFPKDHSGRKENLIVEIKKPTVKVGDKEFNQIKNYAQIVAKDDRFPKDKTDWIFILLATEINMTELSLLLNQNKKEKDLVVESDNIKIYIYKWGDLLNDAEARLSYLQQKLDYKIIEENAGVKHLAKIYSEFLPDEIKMIN